MKRRTNPSRRPSARPFGPFGNFRSDLDKLPDPEACISLFQVGSQLIASGSRLSPAFRIFFVSYLDARGLSFSSSAELFQGCPVFYFHRGTEVVCSCSADVAPLAFLPS